jgi:gluconate 2-dehydrogenase gamma chain
MANTDDILPALIFFNEEEARTIEAITARVIPGDAGNPGAKEAGAVIYIDRSLAGFFSHLQTFYREGIAEFDLTCRAKCGTSFLQLTEHQQDEFLRSIEGSLEKESVEGALRSEGKSRLSQFFAVVYEHTLEGTFGDPIYGGNRGAVGWKMVGFPGAQWSYSDEQMKPGFDASQIKIATLGDLQATIKMSSKNGVKE